MKIKLKDGEALDLDEYRRSLEAKTTKGLVAFDRRLAVLNALQAVLAVRPIIFCSIKDDAKSDGWDDAIRAVHEAAGVIEEDETDEPPLSPRFA